MKKRSLNFFAFVAMLVTAIAFGGCSGTVGGGGNMTDTESQNDHYRDVVQRELKARAGQYGASTRYMMLVDFSIPSNKDRFFVWDTEKDGIVYSTWCAHGCGGGSTAEKPVFSNKPGSNCSSLGLYTVDRGTGVSPKWGYTYHAVDGLDNTNSNARSRQIIIHYWGSVTSDWQNKISVSMNCDYRSAGCFTLPEPSFWDIDKIIKSEPKKILLYAVDGV